MPASTRFLASPLVVAFAACGGGSDGATATPPPPADIRTLSKNGGDGQTAIVGEAVAIAPSVKVSNQSSAPVANVAVTFAVASGGGSVTGGSATTNASGIAAVGSWMMGTTAGTNTLTATAAGVNGGPVTFTVTANAGVPKTVSKQGGDNQTALVAATVAVPPSVKVTDQYNNAVSGVSVTFAVTLGGGSVTGGTRTTGNDGVATVGAWTLGPNEGANALTVTVAGAGLSGNPVSFSATGRIGTATMIDVFMDLTRSSMATIPGMLSSGTYPVPLHDVTTNGTVGSIDFIASGQVGYFIGPPRIAFREGASWTIDLGSAMVAGAPFDFTTFRVCLQPDATSQSPVLLEERDQVNTLLASRSVTSPLPCQDIVLSPSTNYIVLRQTGFQATANSFGGKGIGLSLLRAPE